MTKLTCWELKRCGREPGGENSFDLGICPGSMNITFDGIHDGISAGRACWVVEGTLCNGQIQESFSEKYRDCGLCDVYTAVKREEDEYFPPTIELLRRAEN